VAERNAEIADMITAGKSWNGIQAAPRFAKLAADEAAKASAKIIAADQAVVTQDEKAQTSST
jgi:hypothetical protein